MPTSLSEKQLDATRELLTEIRTKLAALAGDDASILFAMRRRVYARLMYDERGTPAHRAALKRRKREAQSGICPMCEKPLPDTDAELDRLDQQAGYTEANTRLVHQACHRQEQAMRGFTVRSTRSTIGGS